MHEAHSAKQLVRILAGLADRLAARGIVVASLHIDWASFGSWLLEVESGVDATRHSEALLAGDYSAHGPDVLRVVWDGREKELVVSTSPRGILSAPHEWTVHLRQRFESEHDAAIFAERYVLQSLADA